MGFWQTERADYSFTNSLSDFICEIDQNTIKGHEIVEITVKEGLFVDILTEHSQYTSQGDLFMGYDKLPEYIKLALPFGYVKIKLWRKND